MPQCFSLTVKGQAEPMPLAQIDVEICAHLKVDCHPVRWCLGWVDYVGLFLAMGETFEEIKARTTRDYPDRDNTKMLALIDYLAGRFNARCWYESGGR